MTNLARSTSDPVAVSVVIPCHTERQWRSVVAATAALADQPVRPTEIIVVVDHNPALYERARRLLSGVTVLANQRHPGASGNRNTGGFATSTPLIAFLDGDAYPHDGWLAGLIAPFADPAVVGTGGAIRPDWHRRPTWFPDEFLWAVGGSSPTSTAGNTPVRNVWSASMAVRRDAFAAVGGFREGFGKLGRRARPEDTDLCLRMSGAGRWMFVPGSVIDHPVGPESSTFGYFLRRCFSEGRGKVELARLQDRPERLETERAYLRRTLPRAVVRGLVTGARERTGVHAARSGAIVAGVGAAAAGGALASLTYRRPTTGGLR